MPEGLSATLDNAIPDGFVITECYEPQDGPVDITACTYSVLFEESVDTAEIKRFFEADELIVDKKSKKGIKQIDIMPMILGYNISDRKIVMTLSAGTVSNLNPELVLKHMPLDEENTYSVCREKILCGEREFR